MASAASFAACAESQKAQASAVVDSLHALTRQDQDGQLSAEFLEQAERTGGLQSLFIPPAMVEAMIKAGKLPPDVAGLVGGGLAEDGAEDGATGHVSLGDVLDSAKTLSPDQQNVLFSIIQADENQNSLYAIDAAWSSPDIQRNYALLADAVMVRKDDYTYSAQRYFLDSIGGKGLGESFVTFLASAPGGDYGADPEALGGSPERLVSGPRQSIGMTQALDLAARAHDRGMAPDELGYREHHSSNQSRAIGEMFGADGSAPTLKTALPAYLMDLVEGLNDPDLTEEARARLDDAGHDLMGLLGLKPNTNVRTILSTMTPEQWERFGTSLQAFIDGPSATDAPGQPGEKVFADFARWMTLRTPEGARAFAEQNTVSARVNQTYARMSQTLGEWEDKYHISTRSAATLGLIAAVGQGAASIAGLSAGLAMTGTGVGALPGVGLLALSTGGLASAIDTGQASLISLVTGDEHESLTDAAINAAAERMGIPPEAIMALEVGLGVAGMSKYGATATRAVLKAFRSGGEKLAATAFGQKALEMAADKAQGVVDFLSTPLKGFGGLDSRLQMAGGHVLESRAPTSSHGGKQQQGSGGASAGGKQQQGSGGASAGKGSGVPPVLQHTLDLRTEVQGIMDALDNPIFSEVDRIAAMDILPPGLPDLTISLKSIEAMRKAKVLRPSEAKALLRQAVNGVVVVPQKTVLTALTSMPASKRQSVLADIDYHPGYSAPVGGGAGAAPAGSSLSSTLSTEADRALDVRLQRDRPLIANLPRPVRDHYLNLEIQGHGPQRHDGEVTMQDLEDRVAKGHDPMTKSRRDGVTGKKHRKPQYATRFKTPEDFVRAEQAVQKDLNFGTKLQEARKKKEGWVTIEIPLPQALGPNYLSKVEGVTLIDRNDPSKGTRLLNFANGKVSATYRLKSDGTHELITMYVNP